jgi:hypothetical protein
MVEEKGLPHGSQEREREREREREPWDKIYPSKTYSSDLLQSGSNS